MAQVCFDLTDWHVAYAVGLQNARIFPANRLLRVVAKSGIDVIVRGSAPVKAYGDWYDQTVHIFDKQIKMSYEKHLYLMMLFPDKEKLCILSTKVFDSTEPLGNLKVTERGLVFEGDVISDTESRRLYTKLLVLTK